MRSTDRPSNSTPSGASAACPVPFPLETAHFEYHVDGMTVLRQARITWIFPTSNSLTLGGCSGFFEVCCVTQ